MPPQTFSFRVPDSISKKAIAQFGWGHWEHKVALALGESLRYLEGEVKKGTPVNNNVLRGAVDSRITGGTPVHFRGEVGIFGGPAQLYVNAIEDGWHSAKGLMPPVAAIQAWMVAKQIPGGRRRAYLIARAIGRRGYAGHPQGWQMFKKAAQHGKPVVTKIFKKHLLSA